MDDSANFSKTRKDDLRGNTTLKSSSILSLGVTQNLSSKTLRDITNIGTLSELVKQPYNIRGMITNPISNTIRGLSAASVISEMSRQQNYLRDKYNAIFSFQDTLRELSHSARTVISDNSSISIIQHGSAASTLARLANENSGALNPISSALNFISTNYNLFSKQISIYEKLNKHFHEINQLSTPSWLEQIGSKKDYSKATSLSAFEILSANTLRQIIVEYPDKGIEDTEGELDKVSSLIQENKELKLELEKLIKKIAHPTKPISLKKQLLELEDPIKQFSYYVHLNIFRGTEKWSLRTTHNFISLVSYIVVSVYLTTKLGNLFFADNESFKENSNNIVLNIDTRKNINIYGFDRNSIYGISSKQIKVYRRKSVKTNCIGLIFCDTTVRVLMKKGEWLLIESAITKLDKKNKEEIHFVTRRWIKKDAIEFE